MGVMPLLHAVKYFVTYFMDCHIGLWYALLIALNDATYLSRLAIGIAMQWFMHTHDYVGTQPPRKCNIIKEEIHIMNTGMQWKIPWLNLDAHLVKITLISCF